MGALTALIQAKKGLFVDFGGHHTHIDKFFDSQ